MLHRGCFIGGVRILTAVRVQRMYNSAVLKVQWLTRKRPSPIDGPKPLLVCVYMPIYI